ncbi:endothelial cell-specific chemotaxis regulator [Rhynchocyon petersi]
MGTTGATQLCWVILGLLLLQGHNSQSTTTRTSESPQGNVNSLSLTIETTSPNIAPPKKASEVPIIMSISPTPRPNTMDNHPSSSLGLPLSQPQKRTSGLDKSQNVTQEATTLSLNSVKYLTVLPSPTSESVLTVAAFGVISFIVILVVVVIILVSVVSLRFKCRKNKESEDPQKPGSSGISESCSTAKGEKDSITLISMKNINMNNSKGCSSAEKVL